MARLKIEPGDTKGSVSLSVELDPRDPQPVYPKGYRPLLPDEPAEITDLFYNVLGQQWEHLGEAAFFTSKMFGEPWRHRPARQVPESK